MRVFEVVLSNTAAFVVVFGWPLKRMYAWTREINRRTEVLWMVHFGPERPALEHEHVRAFREQRRRDA